MLQKTPLPRDDGPAPGCAGLAAAIVIIIMLVCVAWLLLAPGELPNP